MKQSRFRSALFASVAALVATHTFACTGETAAEPSGDEAVTEPTEPSDPAPEESTPTQPEPTPRASVLTVTGGGGADSTSQHSLHLSIGVPQTSERHETTTHRLQLGPGAAVAP
jgi:hypothetical protein